MKVLRVRPHPKKAGYVQVHLGRWRSNQGFSIGGHCPRCNAPCIDNIEFVQIESDADADLAEASGVKFWSVAYDDVFQHCTACGRFQNTGYGYSPPGHAIPLSSKKRRWPA